MPNIPKLPTHLAILGSWAVSVHRVENESSGVDVVLASEEINSRHFIRRLEVLPQGSLALEIPTDSFPIISLNDCPWAKPFLNESDKSIEPQLIYSLFSKQSARQILTGHLVALRFYPLLRMKQIAQKPDMPGMWEREFKFYTGGREPGTSLTNYTALNYKLLTDWLEAAPSQVLAVIEGVSPSTIRNRLNSARESGLIGKPGSGKRSTKFSQGKN